MQKIPVLSKLISMFQSPGIPWNLDVSFLALVYLALGFFCKRPIKSVIQAKRKKYDFFAIVLAIVLAVLCSLNFRLGAHVYYFDMEPVYYHELLSAVILPCIFGFVLIRFTAWISEIKTLAWLSAFFAFLGRMTIPIMFIHMPVNCFQTQIGYGSTLYVLIGIGVPLVVVIAFGKFPVMRKLLGIPNLNKIGFYVRVER